MAEVAAELERIRAELRSRADPRFRLSVQRFFREPVQAWGVRTPELRRLARESSQRVRDWPAPQLNRLCRELWAAGTLEEAGVAVLIYTGRIARCGHCEWRLFERWINRYVSNWGHCDSICCTLLAALIEREPALANELPAWTASANRWKRRAAAVALVKEARRGRSTELILEVAERLARDPDDMVRKGVGWLLKDAWPARPQEIERFLEANPDIPPLVRRLAMEKRVKRACRV